MKNIITKPISQLGNQLFSIAASRHFAKLTGANYLGVLKDEEGKRYLESRIFRKIKFLEPEKYKNWIIFPENTNSYINPEFKLPDVDNLILYDYFQDCSLIDRDDSLNIFGPPQEIIKEISDLYGDLSEYACLHVRRGDYLDYKGLFKVLDKKYIEKISTKYFKNTPILVISNDLPWCKENLNTGQFIFADKPCKNNLELDFYIQTLCGKGNIISNSTFSWWGAYLNTNPRAKTIVQIPWFDNNFLGGGNRIIPDTWIKII